MSARHTDTDQGLAAPFSDAAAVQNAGFNLTIEEVRILAKYRALSPHQQKGILQAIELIRPADSRVGPKPTRTCLHP